MKTRSESSPTIEGTTTRRRLWMLVSATLMTGILITLVWLSLTRRAPLPPVYLERAGDVVYAARAPLIIRSNHASWRAEIDKSPVDVRIQTIPGTSRTTLHIAASQIPRGVTRLELWPVGREHAGAREVPFTIPIHQTMAPAQEEGHLWLRLPEARVSKLLDARLQPHARAFARRLERTSWCGVRFEDIEVGTRFVEGAVVVALEMHGTRGLRASAHVHVIPDVDSRGFLSVRPDAKTLELSLAPPRFESTGEAICDVAARASRVAPWLAREPLMLFEEIIREQVIEDHAFELRSTHRLRWEDVRVRSIHARDGALDLHLTRPWPTDGSPPTLTPSPDNTISKMNGLDRLPSLERQDMRAVSSLHELNAGLVLAHRRGILDELVSQLIERASAQDKARKLKQCSVLVAPYLDAKSWPGTSLILPALRCEVQHTRRGKRDIEEFEIILGLTLPFEWSGERITWIREGLTAWIHCEGDAPRRLTRCEARGLDSTMLTSLLRQHLPAHTELTEVVPREAFEGLSWRRAYALPARRGWVVLDGAVPDESLEKFMTHLERGARP